MKSILLALLLLCNAYHSAHNPLEHASGTDVMGRRLLMGNDTTLPPVCDLAIAGLDGENHRIDITFNSAYDQRINLDQYVEYPSGDKKNVVFNVTEDENMVPWIGVDNAEQTLILHLTEEVSGFHTVLLTGQDSVHNDCVATTYVNFHLVNTAKGTATDHGTEALDHGNGGILGKAMLVVLIVVVACTTLCCFRINRLCCFENASDVPICEVCTHMKQMLQSVFLK